MTDAHRRRTSDEEGYEVTTKIIDAKLPLTWLLSSAGAIIIAFGSTIWSVANLSSKVDQLIISQADQKTQIAARDVRTDGIRDSVFALQRVVDSLTIKVDAMQQQGKK